MRTLYQSLIAGFVFLALAANLYAAPPPEPGVVHVVLVWLKQPGNTAHRQQIIVGSNKLRQIPGVLDLQVGEVITSDRALVEDSYDIGLYLRFANQQDLRSYLTHPLHQATVKDEFVPIMDHYRVMDFAAAPPLDE